MAMQVDPLLCALLMVKINLPVKGVKALKQPSFQLEMMLFPSLAKTTPVAVKFFTTILSSSSNFITDQRRIDSKEAVAKTKGKLLKNEEWEITIEALNCNWSLLFFSYSGNAMSFTVSVWQVLSRRTWNVAKSK